MQNLHEKTQTLLIKCLEYYARYYTYKIDAKIIIKTLIRH